MLGRSLSVDMESSKDRMHHIFAFLPVVNDHHDKNLLNRLAKKARFRGSIIIQRYERFCPRIRFEAFL